MQILFPSEPDSAVKLNRLLAGKPVGFVGRDLRHRPGQRQSFRLLVGDDGGVIDRSTRFFQADENVGHSMLDGLEAAHRPAELPPCLHVRYDHFK
jgi:hypothetical protein